MRPGILALLIVAGSLAAGDLAAQSADQVLVVVNVRSQMSREIGEYYKGKRSIPAANFCRIDTAPVESITREVYVADVEKPIGNFLRERGLTEKILYIVLTGGVPLIVQGAGKEFRNETASVDSELTLLYQRLHGASIALPGPVVNPFFRQRDTPFRHPLFPMYLVTRLDGWDLTDMKALVDRSLAAQNKGNFVIDLRADNSYEGNQWLRTAALLLPKGRVVMDDSAKVLSDLKNVIGYASWGSNDSDHKHRFLHMQWLPGAIATEFVSTDARTFRKPPDNWEVGAWSGDKKSYFAESPQTLTSDYIHEGASGASGQVDEPYLAFCPRPEYVLPAYSSGRNLAESFYLGIPGLSWMNVVIGDPLMRLK